MPWTRRPKTTGCRFEAGQVALPRGCLGVRARDGRVAADVAGYAVGVERVAAVRLVSVGAWEWAGSWSRAWVWTWVWTWVRAWAGAGTRGRGLP